MDHVKLLFQSPGKTGGNPPTQPHIKCQIALAKWKNLIDSCGYKITQK